MAAYSGRPGPSEHAPFFAGYLDRLPPGDLVEILRAQSADTLALLRAVPAELEGHAYAAGKWTVREVVGHLCDVERVMGCRALRIGRGDATPLPAFDENEYVPEGRFEARPLAHLLDELAAVRAATVALFAGLPGEAWKRVGTVSGHPLSVRAIAGIIAGHERHHLEILRDRYGLTAGSSRAGRPAGTADAPLPGAV